MAQTLNRFAGIAEKDSPEAIDGSVAEIDAKEFRRARRDPKLRQFAKAADDRLGELRARGRID